MYRSVQYLFFHQIELKSQGPVWIIGGGVGAVASYEGRNSCLQ